jgi:hypothetical protein
MRALKWLVFAVAVFVGLGAVLSATKHRSDSGSSTTSAAAQHQAATRHRGDRRSRPCSGITRSAHTSCRFAVAVVRAYKAHPSATVIAHSPVTHRTYAMQCQRVAGIVSCAGGVGASVAFNGPPIRAATPPRTTSTPPTPTPTTGTSVSIEGPGSSDHSTDAQFCSSHHCIPNFPNGNGYIVQCVDGQWSHSGGLSGACSDHGGER